MATFLGGHFSFNYHFLQEDLVNESNNEGQSTNFGENSARPAWKKGGESAPGASSERASRPERDGERNFSDRPRRDSDRPRRDSDRPRRDSDRPRRDSDRDGRSGGGFRGSSERPGRAGEGREGRERPEWQQRVERTRDPNRPKSPMLPDEITETDLDLLVRVQFKTLSPENSERVSRHLAMVNLLINQDPELAHQHALAAADRAGRIGIVRETLGLTAYTVGDFALALRELQAYRRISGLNDQLPVMVDCERGMGRPDKALELGRSVDPKTLEPGVRANLAIALSGARLDRGENDLALAELEIAELNPESVFDYSPQLFWAYSDTLEILGRAADAKRWANLAERAEKALAAKKAPAHEVIDIIEEIEIPEPYESKKIDGSDRPARSLRDGERRFGDRAARDGERRFGDRAPRDGERRFGDRAPRDGERGGRFSRDGDRPARPARDGARSPRDGERRFGGDRPARPSRDGERRFGDRPARPARDGERPARPASNGDRPVLRFGNERPARPPRDGDRPARGSDRPTRNNEKPTGSDGDGERPGWKRKSDD